MPFKALRLDYNESGMWAISPAYNLPQSRWINGEAWAVCGSPRFAYYGGDNPDQNKRWAELGDGHIESCMCGIHSTDNVRVVKDYLRGPDGFLAELDLSHESIPNLRIAKHRGGYRSEYARIVAVIAPDYGKRNRYYHFDETKATRLKTYANSLGVPFYTQDQWQRARFAAQKIEMRFPEAQAEVRAMRKRAKEAQRA